MILQTNFKFNAVPGKKYPNHYRLSGQSDKYRKIGINFSEFESESKNKITGLFI
jgi:hypothetical protein